MGGRLRAAGAALGRGAAARSPASMSAKERQKGKVTKDSVTLLPCFYFVEVSGRCCAGRAGLAAGAGSGAEPIRGER